MAENLAKNEIENNLISNITYSLKSENFASEGKIDFSFKTLSYSKKTNKTLAGVYYSLSLKLHFPKLTAESEAFFDKLMKDHVIFYINFANGKKISLGNADINNYPFINVDFDGEQLFVRNMLSIDFNSLNPITYN